MSRAWRQSLEGRLLVRLSALLVLAMAGALLAAVVASYRTAQELANEALAHEFVAEFVSDGAWFIPVFALLVLAVAALTVRSVLRPLHTASERAASIAPGATDVRLPVEDLPSEVRPLVMAVNGALDRLEAGFQAQRRFTADAAHELRTPLSILTAALDGLEASPDVERLRLDAARMNRIVGQLLAVSRLDGQPTAREALDLGPVASEVVEQLAPLAIAAGRRIALEAPDGPVRVLGNGDALAGALRNLVENAIRHTPVGGEVIVSLQPDGRLCVADQGPGVPPEHRGQVFDRFWRGAAERASATGAGLGLAIVAEVVRVHQGSVSVATAEGGGALFCMALPRLDSAVEPGPDLPVDPAKSRQERLGEDACALGPSR